MSNFQRPPSSEPTLMIGDVPLNFDFTFVDDFICNTYPQPVTIRRSLTKNKDKINSFYQYTNFQDAQISLRKLNGSRVPGMDSEFQLDMNFTKQKQETCVHLTICDLHFTRFEIMKLMSRYESVLGLAQYKFGLHDGRTPKTTCFVRFGNPEDCLQVVQELNGFPIESSFLHITFSMRYIDQLKEYVINRETQKVRIGIPEFHNIYSKQVVSVDKYNEIIMDRSNDLFDELEGSRWTPIVFHERVFDNDFIRQMTMNTFENL